MDKIRNLIGVSAGIGGGKDLVGKIINYLTHYRYDEYELKRSELGISVEDFYDTNMSMDYEQPFVINKYANKLKDVTALILGCTRKDLEDRDYKDKMLGGVWNEYYVKFKYKLTTSKYFSIPMTLKFNSESEAKFFIENGNELYPDIKDCEFYVKSLSPRDFQVIIGTDCGRNMINENIWVNALFSDYKGHTPKVHTGYMMDEGCYSHSSCNMCKSPFYGYKRQLICRVCVNEKGPFFPNWIITDVRFPNNEGKAITDRGGFVIGLNRKFSLKFPEYDYLEDPNSPYDIPISLMGLNCELYEKLTKESEISMGDLSWCDYVVENNETIDELVEKIKVILTYEKLIKI